ncbi:MAG: recombination mediator RecR [Bacilli bacterium]|nr:recombination mediator RecR [Bacilli bacterium]
MYPESLNNLIESFKKLPGIGQKTAERLAFAVMKFDDASSKKFSESILKVKNNLKRCVKCNHLTETELCDVCADKNRDKQVLCVVEHPKTIILFEKLNIHNGIYHVLDNLISPAEGIGPDDINLHQLVSRIEEEKCREIVLAIKPTIEGETTALYIKKILAGMNIKLSKIAYGIPMGADIEYVDSMTLELAFTERTPVS